jgi:antitoxin component YwqK of YwqJK toxin-antitoxin module
MWPNGQIYDGEFKNDDCNGQGTLYYPDGKRFEGPWKDGKKHGKGFYVFPNGARYHVLYNDGKKKEQGRLEDSKVKLDELKETYGNLYKRDVRAKEHLEFAVKGANNFHRADVQRVKTAENPFSR